MKTIVKQCWSSAINYISRFTATQLVLTLASIPILISWGLGCSVMTFVGNLVFTPILTVFLMLSSLMLFTELLGIPNGGLVWLLDAITVMWNKLLHYGSSSWMFSWSKPPTAVLVCIPIVIIAVLRWRAINTPMRRLLALVALTMAIGCVLSICSRITQGDSLAMRFAPNLYTIKLVDQPSLIVIDEGFFARKKSIAKLVAYELKPWITKHYGSVRLSELRLTVPSDGSFKAAKHICSVWKVDAVWIPFFNKSDITNAGWHSFFELRRYAQEHRIAWRRYKPLKLSKNFGKWPLLKHTSVNAQA